MFFLHAFIFIGTTNCWVLICLRNKQSAVKGLIIIHIVFVLKLKPNAVFELYHELGIILPRNRKRGFLGREKPTEGSVLNWQPSKTTTVL